MTIMTPTNETSSNVKIEFVYICHRLNLCHFLILPSLPSDWFWPFPCFALSSLPLPFLPFPFLPLPYTCLCPCHFQLFVSAYVAFYRYFTVCKLLFPHSDNESVEAKTSRWLQPWITWRISLTHSDDNARLVSVQLECSNQGFGPCCISSHVLTWVHCPADTMLVWQLDSMSPSSDMEECTFHPSLLKTTDNKAFSLLHVDDFLVTGHVDMVKKHPFLLCLPSWNVDMFCWFRLPKKSSNVTIQSSNASVK